MSRPESQSMAWASQLRSMCVKSGNKVACYMNNSVRSSRHEKFDHYLSGTCRCAVVWHPDNALPHHTATLSRPGAYNAMH